MKHLDTLLDELQEPIAQLMDWCDADKDRAVIACILDLCDMQAGVIFEVFREAFDDVSDFGITELIYETFDEISYAKRSGCRAELDYDALYLPLERIINDRIDDFNS